MRHTFKPALASLGTTLVASTALAQGAPDPAQAKQQLLAWHQAASIEGVCGMFQAFGEWQEANWPDGRPVFEHFMTVQVLPSLPVHSALKDRTPHQIQNGLVQFCTDTGLQSSQYRYGLALFAEGPADRVKSTEDQEQARRISESLDVAEFFGECATVAPLYFEALAEEKEKTQQFVRDRVYGEHPQYRWETPVAPDAAGIEQANLGREKLYWSDCRQAQAAFNRVIAELRAPP